MTASEPDTTPTHPAPDDRSSWVELVEIVGAMLAIFVLDLLAGWEIQFATVFPRSESRILDQIEFAGSVVFVVIAIVAVAAGLRRGHRALLKVFTVYLVVATIQTVANIAALLGTQHERSDSYLWGLWDVGAAYLMIVAVFTGWYWVADQLIPGGAFVFPVPEGKEPEEPTLTDYLFIAFNTNATFGPTTEAVVSRKIKVLMMFQTVCSLLILLILVARVVSMQQ